MRMRVRGRRLLIAVFSAVLFAGLAFWATGSLWAVGAIGNHYDWGWPLTGWQGPISQFLWSWDARFLGGAVIFHFGWIMSGLLSLVGTLLSITVQVALKGWLVAAIIGAGTGMTWLLRRRGLPWWVAILMGVVYSLYPTLFVRFIVGFVAYIMAYALLPWWLSLWWSLPETKRPWRVIPAAALIYALTTAQQQFSVMILLIMVVDIWLSWMRRRPVKRQLVSLAVSVLTVLIFHLPWLWLSLRGGVGLTADLGQASSSLALISSLPHDIWRTLFGFDHHITYPIFDALRYGSTFALSCWGLLLLFFLGVRQSRPETRLAVVIIGLTWPLSLGPVDATKSFYIWIYQHMPLANLFRETFHWSVLTAFFLVIGAAYGLAWLASKRWWGKIGAVILGVAILGLLRPFAEGKFFNYLTPQRTNEAYLDLNMDGATALQSGRTFFLPSLGFIKDRHDKTPGAANSDIFAESTGRPQLPYVSSTLDLPDAGNELRNVLLTSWYQLPGAPSDARGYLNALGVSSVVTRPNLVSNFIDLFPAKPYLEPLRRHWAEADYDRLTQAQPGLERVSHTASWTEYRVVAATPKITLAKQPVVAAFDWTAIAGSGDAVFYREDLAARGQLSGVAGLPVVADKTDWLAAGWLTYDHRRDLVVDAGSNPDFGWTKKNSVWWRSSSLAAARETYYFTATDQTIAGTAKVTKAGDYHWLVKVWQGPRAQSITLHLGDSVQTLMTGEDGVGRFVWHDLGTISLAASSSLSVKGEGEVGVAQWLLVPESTYTADLTKWPGAGSSAKAPTGDVSFKQRNATAYDLSVTTDRESWLIVRESFDEGWELRLGDQVYHPVPVDGYAMAFSIPGGSWTGQLVFAPQSGYRVLQIVTIIYLTALVLLSFWTPPRRRQRRSAISL